MRLFVFSGLFVLGFALASLLGPALQDGFSPAKLTSPRDSLNNLGTAKDQLLKNLKQEIISTDSNKSHFNFLRSDNLKSNPQMYMAITPELRSYAIESLVSRLNDADWVLWKENLSTYGSPKSEARRWLDGIKVVNFELGRYLETSALLFTALYHASTLGRVFSVEEELYELSTEATTLFQAVTPKAYSPRINLDTSVTSDPSFLMWLEQLRSQFVINYSKREPKQLETQLLLLASVKQEFLTPPVLANYVRLIDYATKEISPKYRLELKDHYLQNGRESELIEISEEFSSSFSDFYVSCFDDVVAEGEIPRAKALVLKFGEYFPKSPSIAVMQNKISKLEVDRKAKVEALNNVVKPLALEPVNSKIGFSDYLSDVSNKTSLRELVEGIGMWIIIILTFGLIVIKSIPFVLLYFNSRRIRRERAEASKQVAEKESQNQSDEPVDNRGNMIPITKPLASKGNKFGNSREKRQANS